MRSDKVIKYDVSKSVTRIDNILNLDNSKFEESESIPDRSKLTYENGYYVNVGAIFIDIRQSSTLTDEHKRPKLAKLYRSYISEVVAILNSFSDCKEINIVGDCVSGIFDNNMDGMLNASTKISSLVTILNYKYSKKDIVNIEIGIGLDFGRALMIKAGYSGSGISDVVWMGDVVNNASNLCNEANKNGKRIILVSENVYEKLCKENKEILEKKSYFDKFYQSKGYNTQLIDIDMNEWYKENCK